MKNILVICIVLIGLFCSCSKDESSPVKTDLFQCEIDNPTQKGDRLLGMDLLDLTESNNFDQNINLAKDLKVDFIALHLPWSSIETTPNNYEDPFSAMELLGQVAAANNFKFSLTIRPIDLTGKTVPSDLENLRFNDPIMMSRFKSLVDFILTKVSSSDLLNFQIGNEIDGYNTSAEPATFWEDYGEFLQEITNYIHGIDTEVKVGFTGTHRGLLQNPTRFNTLLQSVDILGVTYYPLNNDFTVKDPNTALVDMKDLVNAYTTKPIYLQEVGYQSSEENKSSEEKQANFFCYFFKAWDAHTDRIKSANIVRLNDLSQQSALEAAGPYGYSGNEFLEYLRTLGLRKFKNEGENKKAFDIIRESTESRGW